MEKIAYIVPSEAMILSTQKVLQKEIERGEVDVLTTDIFHPMAEYKRLCGEGYGCLIARGGTYSDMEKFADVVPIMEERIRTSDILYMLKRVRAKYEGKVYVILHQRTAKKFEESAALYQFPVEVKRYSSSEELKDLIDQIPETNVVVLSSGIASRVSARTDLTMVELLNRDTTIRETVKVAKGFLSQFQENIKKVNVMESILNNVDEGILIFDDGFIAQEMNAKAEELLQVPMDEVIGQDVHKVIPDLPPKRMDGSCSEASPAIFVRQVHKQLLNFTVHPFEFFRGEKRYIATMQDVTKIQALEHGIRLKLARKGLTASYHFDDILTVNPSMQKLIRRAETIAGFEGSVLIYGENGTGKELFAQSIHNASSRKNGPFVAVNCAALTESILESELFGYVGGAFTGARKEGKAGLFELAHQGTIFLDEINSMPLSLQAKLLRVLEQQEVMRVGSDYVIPLDIRIIAASNTDMEERVDSGNFRRDLYFRLNTFQLNIPPLSQRKDDILLLFKYHLAQLEGISMEDIHLDQVFADQLTAHPWQGNVREVKSAALRYHAFEGDNSTGDILGSGRREDQTGGLMEKTPLPGGSLLTEDFHIDLHQLNKEVERLVVESLIDRGLTKSEVAAVLGISRQALYKKLNTKD